MGTYRLTTSYDCGPAAISAVTDIPLDKVKEVMRWKDSQDFRDNLMDSPANAFLALQRLSVPYRVVTCGQILRGECRNDKTIILIHGDGLVGSWLAQHYVVLAYVRSESGQTFIGVHWGDGTIHQYASDKFQERYANGGPTATAYEVYPSTPKPVTKYSWWAKLMARIFGR